MNQSANKNNNKEKISGSNMSAGGHILYINPNINQNGGIVFHINSATMTNLSKDSRSHGNVLLILDGGLGISSYNILQMKR